MKLGIYRHYKTGIHYRTLGFAQCANNERVVEVAGENDRVDENAAGQDMVIYISLATGKVYCRDVVEFDSQRFKYIGEHL